MVCAPGGRVSVALSVRVRARVFPPPIAKRVQESLDIQTGVPWKRVQGGVREPRLFSPPLFIPRRQSNRKICLLRQSQSPAALASARGRPRSSSEACGALGSPDCENRGGLAAITSLLPSLICLLLTPSNDFSSRLTSSLPLTYTHTHTSSVPLSRPPFGSLGKGNWTERFTFRKAVSATYFSRSPALAGPRSPTWRSCRGGSGRQGGEALRLAGQEAGFLGSGAPCSCF